MNSQTLLLRQVHPSFVQSDRVTSQAFRPTPKDEGRLSVYDGDQILPEPAWRHYTEVLGLASAGVLAVLGAECDALGLRYRLTADPFAEHAEIDFGGLAAGALEKAAKKLRAAAESRGWLFRGP